MRSAFDCGVLNVFLQKDTLMELSFHVPSTNATYIGDEERPSAQVWESNPENFLDGTCWRTCD